MAGRITICRSEKPVYDIVLERSFSTLADELSVFFEGHRKICIVTDSNVAEYHLKAVEEALRPFCSKVSSFIFVAGEENKSLDTVRDLYETLIKGHFDRSDLLIALGGGVVGDLTGYTAATYLRGIDFVQIPTSLLAQVDSSIGGKTGVDFDQYKNMVGAFHQPRLVFINLNTLNTLPKRQYLSGIGEIIKHGLIKDKDYYQWLQTHSAPIMDKNMEVCEEMITRSCRIKQEVVERDPLEKGERALLNFGHTLGHAVEKLLRFTYFHGECVSVGMVGALSISFKRGYITEEDFSSFCDTLKKFELPVKVPGLKQRDILNTVKHDKKMDAGKLKFILLSRVGRAYIEENVTDDELAEAIKELQEVSYE